MSKRAWVGFTPLEKRFLSSPSNHVNCRLFTLTIVLGTTFASCRKKETSFWKIIAKRRLKNAGKNMD
jgi:hypothetical protein